jgi:hypothetical protein
VARTWTGDHGIELLKVFVKSIVVEDEAWVVDEDRFDCNREAILEKIYDIVREGVIGVDEEDFAAGHSRYSAG